METVGREVPLIYPHKSIYDVDNFVNKTLAAYCTAEALRPIITMRGIEMTIFADCRSSLTVIVGDIRESIPSW